MEVIFVKKQEKIWKKKIISKINNLTKKEKTWVRVKNTMTEKQKESVFNKILIRID